MNTEMFNRHIFWYLTNVFYLNVMIKHKMTKVQLCTPVGFLGFKKYLFLLLFSLVSILGFSQAPDIVFKPYIHSVRFHMYGDQLSLPVYNINSGDQMELNFDDMEGNIKSYYYSFQLCDYDWQPVDISPFNYIKGFTQQRITTYRYSSIALTRYTHYQAILPDRSSAITIDRKSTRLNSSHLRLSRMPSSA